MLQEVDLADDGLPFFHTIGGQEFAVIDAKALRVLQDKAARWDELVLQAQVRAIATANYHAGLDPTIPF